MLHRGGYRVLVLVATSVQCFWVLFNLLGFCRLVLGLYIVFRGFVQAALASTFVEYVGFLSSMLGLCLVFGSRWPRPPPSRLRGRPQAPTSVGAPIFRTRTLHFGKTDNEVTNVWCIFKLVYAIPYIYI